MGKFSWFGIVLILVGSAMMLDRVGVVRLGWEPILWSLLAVFGAVRAMDGFSKKKSGRVFWGTFLFLLGVYGVLRYLDIVELRSYSMMPAILVIVGLSMVMSFVSSPRDWHLLIPALLLLGTGSAIILSDFGYLYRYDVTYALRTYWPIGIILFGFALVLRGVSFHSRASR
jgi:hypothetical protein